MCGGEAGNGGREGSIIALSIVSIIVLVLRRLPYSTWTYEGRSRNRYSFFWLYAPLATCDLLSPLTVEQLSAHCLAQLLIVIAVV